MATAMQPYPPDQQPVRERITRARLLGMRRDLLKNLEFVQRLLERFPSGSQYGYVPSDISQQLAQTRQTLASIETQLMPSVTTGKLPELHPSPREQNTDPIHMSRSSPTTGPIPMLHEQTVPLSDVWMRDGWIFTRHAVQGDLQSALAQAILRHRNTIGKRAQYLYVNQINRQMLEMRYPSGHYQDEQGPVFTVMNPDLSANETWCATRIPPQAS